MEEWKSYQLSDVANLTTGFPFDGHKYAKDGVRVVRGDNVTIGSLRWDTDKDKRWNEPFSRACEYTLYDGDIVIGMDGSRVGKNRAQISKEDLPLFLAQRVACIRHNEKSCQEFLYYQIFSDRFVDYIKAVQTGTSIPHVSLKQIGDFPILLPPIEDQIRIAKILRSLDDKIALNNRINHNLEEQAQALYKSWFVDFEPFKEEKFVESELGMIPSGWDVKRVGDLPLFIADYVANGSFASLKENVRLYESEQYAVFIRNTDLKTGVFPVFVDTHSYNFLSKTKLSGGEIIISNVGDVGSVHFCPVLNRPMTLGNNVIMIKADEGRYYSFLYLCF